MAKVFIGGSRDIPALPALAVRRLANVVDRGHSVLVGDADGIDRAVQVHLRDIGHRDVTVFHAEGRCRNNLGDWPGVAISPPASARGYAFHAAKDREMAAAADHGLMIWDGRSNGTALNVLRLVRAGKSSVMIDAAAGRVMNFLSADDWECFVDGATPAFVAALRSRATREEWDGPAPETLPDLFGGPATPPRR